MRAGSPSHSQCKEQTSRRERDLQLWLGHLLASLVSTLPLGRERATTTAISLARLSLSTPQLVEVALSAPISPELRNRLDDNQLHHNKLVHWHQSRHD